MSVASGHKSLADPTRRRSDSVTYKAHRNPKPTGHDNEQDHHARRSRCTGGRTRPPPRAAFEGAPPQKALRGDDPEEFRAALNQLGLSIVASAEHLGLSYRQSQRYASGTSPVADPVAKLLRLAIPSASAPTISRPSDLTRDITPGERLPGLGRCRNILEVRRSG